jgi:hypothetical protein
MARDSISTITQDSTSSATCHIIYLSLALQLTSLGDSHRSVQSTLLCNTYLEQKRWYPRKYFPRHTRHDRGYSTSTAAAVRLMLWRMARGY